MTMDSALRTELDAIQKKQDRILRRLAEMNDRLTQIAHSLEILHTHGPAGISPARQRDH
jgi:hypothetical protein